MGVDVDALKASVSIVDVVSSYVRLQKRGAEFVGLCVAHADKSPSMWVQPHKGFVHCFSCGWSADVIAFVQHMQGVDFNEACRILGAPETKWTPTAKITQEAPPRPDRVTSKPPADAGVPDMKIRALGEPSKTWCYRDSDGAPIGYVARYDIKEGKDEKKEIRCWSWGGRGDDPPSWGCGHFTKPRPLYGLERIGAAGAKQSAPILLVEGEKAADAAQALLGQYVVCTWPGGAQAWKHADLEPLRGRRVDLWPDADEPGRQAMAAIAALIADPKGLACHGKLIDPRGLPEGGDAADLTGEDPIPWLRERAAWYREPDPVPQAEPRPPLSSPAAVVEPAGAGPSEPPPDEQIPLEAYAADPPGARAASATVGKRRAKPALSVVGNTALAADPDAEPLPQSMSEDSLADHFAATHGEDWRYVREWAQWFEWDADRWLEDKTSKAERLAIHVTREAIYWPQAAGLTSKEKRQVNKKSTAWALRDLAATDRRCAATIEQWDVDPLLLGVPGGVVDLRDGSMLQATREQYISKRTACAPAAGEPRRWLDYLARVHDGNEAIIAYLQRYAGYCATGETKEHALAFLYGTGRNGKGVFLETVSGILGEYARTASMDTFMQHTYASHSTELARLRGARCVITEEAASGGRWNEARIKHVTGGGKITAHLMRQDDFEFTPNFKLLIAANHKPMLRSVDEAIKSRIHLVPFSVTIPLEERDQNLLGKLREEWPQILGWMLDGCSEWQAGGLAPPQAVLDATAQYVESEDVLGAWLEECCERGSLCRMEGAAGYQNFCGWCERQGERAMSRRSWSNVMIERGFENSKDNRGTRLFLGVELKPFEPQPGRYPDA